ncbi:MAG: hypothetical protein AB7F99_10985, partial [Vicinamibacterales bacterium]
MTMKRSRFARSAFAVSLAGPLFTACLPAPAGNTTSAQTVHTSSEDVLMSGRTVRIQTAVEGDVAAAGEDITIDGPVGGYVMGAGRHITLEAPVENDVWLAGEQVDVESEIGSNAMIAGRIVTLRPGTVVSDNARLAGEHVRSEAHVSRDLRVGAITAEIGGEIEGQVYAAANQVR